MLQKKNIKLGKNKFYILILSFICFISSQSFSSNNLEGSYTVVKVLDKISSKNDRLKLQNNKETIFKDLSIKNPENI